MEKRTVLIVDDTFENLYLLKVILEGAGYTVIAANDGKEALKKLEQNKELVNLIISDILMPVMDGYLFCQACKRDDHLKMIPFVFYTSTYTEKLDEEFALKLGATRYLRKPMDPDLLVNTINEILELSIPKVQEPTKSNISEDEVLKLYSARLINKLEQKSLDLSKEIEERKKTEELLTQKNQELDVIYSNLSHPVFMLEVLPSNAYNFVSVNTSFLTTLGITRNDVINKSVRSLIPEPSLSLVLSKYQEVVKTKKSVNWEETTPYKTGVKTALVSVNPLFNADGECTHLIGLVYDITERKKVENDLREAKEFTESLINSMENGLSVIDRNKKHIHVNPALCTITGFSKEELLGIQPPFPYWPPEYCDEINDIVEKTLLGINMSGETTFMRKNGERFPAQLSISTVRNEAGEGVLFFAAIEDISVKVKAREELRAAKEFSENLIKSMNEGLVVLDFNNVITAVNPAFCAMTGFSESELIGSIKPFKFSPPENHKIVEERIKLIKLDQLSDSFESVYMHKDGTRFPVHIIISSIKDQNGNKIARFATVQDISIRRKAELELKLAREYTDKLIESMQEGLIIVDLNGKIIMVNNSTCKILGYKQEELLGLNLPYPFAKLEDFELIGKYNQRISEGEALTFKFEFIRKNGERFIASFLTGNIKNDKGEVVALFGTMKDVAEEERTKKLLEENAVKSNKKKEVILELAEYVGKGFEKSLIKITKLAAQTLNVGRVSVWSFNRDNSAINCHKLYNLATDKFEDGHVLKYEDNPDYFKTLADHKTIIISNAQTNKITKKFTNHYLKPNGIKSLMDVFVNSTDGYYGIICFEHVGEELKNWSPEEQEFATSIANIVSLMVESNERKSAELELKIEKEFSETLITSLNEGLSVVDLNGIHIKVNAALCEMTGFSEEELVGIKAPFPYWPPEYYDKIFEEFNNPLKSLGINKEAVLMKKNGERFPVSLSDSIIKNKDGKIIAYFTTITDITMRVKADMLLKENIRISNQRKNSIIELANLIGNDFNESLKKIATTTAQALKVDFVTIWEFKSKKTEILSKLHYKAETNEFSSDGLKIKKEQIPNYFKAFKKYNSIIISDVVNNPITKDLATKFFIPNNISSRIDVLVYGRNDHYGILSFESTEKDRTFNNEEETFVTSIASVVSLMVESYERKLAEQNMAKINEQLINVNKELNALRNQLEQENIYLRNELDLVFNFEEMVYSSAVFSKVLTDVEKVASTNATVLLLGESGTGKELLARAVHNVSLRNNKPLIKVNCSAIPRELIESELFGHKKGSFTGAFNDKIGKFELADGGTLFLDEIGELPLDMQPKILRFLQEGEIEVVGDTKIKKLDVRVIAATNRNLLEEIEKKQFREDLYFRLNVFPIIVPPLRNRKEDIPILIEHFVDKFNKAYAKNIKYIPDDSMSQLQAYNWPGNIRELENLIERASILSTDETLRIPGFESKIKNPPKIISQKNLSLDYAQKNHILQVLEECNWKITGVNGAASLLDLKPSTLRDKMTKFNIKKPK